jgi:hypothetical protein
MPFIDAINYSVLRDIKPPKDYAKKTTLAELDPDGRFEKWWDDAIDRLAKDFNKIHPTGTLEDWQEYLSIFIDNARQHIGIDLFAATDEERVDPTKLDFFRKLVTPLAEKVNIQFNQIEKVRANWRYNSNKSFMENVQVYASHPNFLVQTAEDSSRKFDNLHFFLGTKDTRLFHPITQKNYKAFHQLASSWKKASPEFVKTIQAINKGEDVEDYSQVIKDINRMDSNGEFRALSTSCLQDIDKFYYQVDPSGKYYIECILDELFPDEKGSLEMYARESSILRSSYVAIFFQWLIEDLVSTPRYLELRAKGINKLTGSELKEFNEYTDRSLFLNTLATLLQENADNPYTSKPAPYVQQIQKSIAEFKMENKPAEVEVDTSIELEAWMKEQIIRFSEHLHTEAPGSKGKFFIQEAIDGVYVKPAFRTDYEHYNLHYQEFYDRALTEFTHQLVKNHGNNDPELKARLIEHKEAHQKELYAKVASLVPAQKSGMVGKLNTLRQTAEAIPLVHIIDQRQHVISQITHRAGHFINDFFREPRLYSSHDFNELQNHINKPITQETTEVLETTKQPSIIKSIMQQYKKFTAFISSLFSSAKKDESLVIAQFFTPLTHDSSPNSAPSIIKVDLPANSRSERPSTG